MSYLLKIATVEDLERMKSFFNKVYREGHIMTEEKHLEWQFQKNPWNFFHPSYSNLLLINNDEIMGHLGLIPYNFVLKGRNVRGAFLSSLIVKEDLRSRGAGIYLVREAEKYFDILCVLGLNAQAVPVYKYCGWSEVFSLRRWFCEKKNFVLDDCAQGYAVQELKTLDNSWNLIWKKTKDQWGCLIERSPDYLDWRFLRHPYIKYKIYQKKDEGYIILRKEVGNEYRAGRIVDFFSQPQARVPLLHAAMSYARKENLDFVDFFCSSSIYENDLMKCGFDFARDELGEPPVYVLPTDRRRSKIGFSYKINNLTNSLNPEDWFVVKSDGDKDRAW